MSKKWNGFSHRVEISQRFLTRTELLARFLLYYRNPGTLCRTHGNPGTLSLGLAAAAATITTFTPTPTSMARKRRISNRSPIDYLYSQMEPQSSAQRHHVHASPCPPHHLCLSSLPSVHTPPSFNTRTPGYPPPPTTPAMHEMNTPLPLPRPSVRSCRLCPPYLPSSTRLARLLDTAASSRPLPSPTKNGLRTTY